MTITIKLENWKHANNDVVLSQVIQNLEDCREKGIFDKQTNAYYSGYNRNGIEMEIKVNFNK